MVFDSEVCEMGIEAGFGLELCLFVLVVVGRNGAFGAMRLLLELLHGQQRNGEWTHSNF